MKTLVTGCAGFIGYHLTNKLLSEGHEVVGVDNINSYYSPALKKSRLEQLGVCTEQITENTPIRGKSGFTFIKANLEEKTVYTSHLDSMQFETVCHMAAQAGVRYSIENPQAYIDSNIQGFMNILEYCRHHSVKRLVFASSSSVYGKNASIPYREADVTDSPVSLYAATKKSNELLAHCYSELYKFQSIGLRFFTVYGPWGRPDMAPFLFTKAIIEGSPINVFNYGNMMRDFTYVDDIIQGVYKVSTNELANKLSDSRLFRVYNIGSSQPIKLKSFIEEIEKLTGKKANCIYKPLQPGDVLQTWADTTCLQTDYNYKPDTVLKEGMGAFVDWYKAYFKIN